MKNYNHPIRQCLSRIYRGLPGPARKFAAPLRAVMAQREAVRQMNEEILPGAAFIRKHALGYQGQKIVVDCGFNTGVVLKQWLQELPDFKFYGFEVNPQFKSIADDFRRNHPNILDLEFAAVNDRDGEITFWLAGDKQGVHVREGTTILPQKQSYMTEYKTPYTARSIDFARWLREKSAQHTDGSGKPFIAVKMDIEGAEVPLLEHLLATRAIDFIDVLIVEFHAEQFDEEVRASFRSRETKILEDLKKTNTAIHLWF